MSGQTQHSPVKTSNLPDKCPMTGANLQACIYIYIYIYIYVYISNTNEDKTHFQDHLYFDQLVGLPQGEVYLYKRKSKSKHTRQRSAVATWSFTPVGDLQARSQDVTFAYICACNKFDMSVA